MARAHLVALALTFIFWILAGMSAFGQQQSAELTGRITDPSGASLPGATVTVMNAGRGIRRVVKSDDHGDYVVPLLPPASGYQITVSKTGFKQAVQRGITLQVARIDLMMEIGSVRQSVRA